MAENKTKATDESVEAFINKVASDQKREDAKELVKLFEKLTGEPPVMWGLPSLVLVSIIINMKAVGKVIFSWLDFLQEKRL